MSQPDPQAKAMTPPRLRGYVLISVLIALALLTTVIFTLQSQLLRARSDLNVERALGVRADDQERLIAAAGSLISAAEPVDLGGVWGLAIPANGLVDVNLAPPELIAAAFLAAEVPLPATIAEAQANQYARIGSWFSVASLTLEDRVKLAPFVTVQSGQTSVDPNAAAPAGRAAFASALQRTGRAAATETMTYLLLMGADRGGPFTPIFYVGATDTGAYRLSHLR